MITLSNRHPFAHHHVLPGCLHLCPGLVPATRTPAIGGISKSIQLFDLNLDETTETERERIRTLLGKLYDDSLIDAPLKAIGELAQVYSQTGLAADEAAAKRMADAFKDAVAQQYQDKRSDRSPG